MNEPESGDRGNAKSLSRKFGIWLPLAVVVGLILAVVAGSYSRLTMRMPLTAGASALAAVPAGTVLNLIVEVTAIPSPGVLNARVLDKDGARYVRTRENVQLDWQADTRMNMGNRDDVRPGAILEVSAQAQGRNSKRFSARSLTVLTGYVQVH